MIEDGETYGMSKNRIKIEIFVDTYYKMVMTKNQWECIGSYKCDQLIGLMECIKNNILNE